MVWDGVECKGEGIEEELEMDGCQMYTVTGWSVNCTLPIELGVKAGPTAAISPPCGLVPSFAHERGFRGGR